MTGTDRDVVEFVPQPVAVSAPPRRRPFWFKTTWARLVISWGLAVIGGVVWGLATPLADYTVNDDGSLSTTQLGMFRSVAPVVWFSIIALILGVVIAELLWPVLRGLGAVCVALVIAAVVVAEGIVWGIGTLVGPGPLDPRALAAAPGAVLPDELALATPVPLAIGPFAASLMLLLVSCLGRDPDEASAAEEPDERWAPADENAPHG